MNAPSFNSSTHHVAGLDDRDRGFNRQIHIISGEGGFQAHLRYELLQIEVDPLPGEDQALHRLIQVLQDRGYTQLRTQRIFIGDRYLGNQELWVEYPDPESSFDTGKTWSTWFRQLFGRSSPL